MPRRRRHAAGEGTAPDRLFVDSGAWIALFSARDRHHTEADRMFRQAVSQRIPLLTTNLIVAEVHRFLLFRAGIRPAARALDQIEASALVTIEFTTATHHRAARTWLARLADQRITYTDAVSFAVMETARCTITMSFDHDFSLAGFSLWQPGQ